MVLAAPVCVEESSRCAPSVPCTTVAVMPGLPAAELIAVAMPLSVSLLLLTVTLKLAPPRLNCRVPLPRVVVPVLARDFDRSCCAWASAVTDTLYVPTGAPEVAVAVTAAELLVFAVCVSNAVGLSSVLKADWNVDRALFRVPSAEICVVTACV